MTNTHRPPIASGAEVAKSICFPNPSGRYDIVDNDNGLPIKFADGPQLDSFSRVRVRIPRAEWEGKHLYGEDSHSYQNYSVGAGSGHAYRSSESSVRITCDTGASDKVIHQTKKYIPYIPGHSQIAFATFIMHEAPSANCRKRVGRFDNYNGPYLEWNDTDIRFVVRTDTSGTPVDTAYWVQSDWNLDTLDGSGDSNNPSGLTLDLTKDQILVIDFQWLGVGRVRFGFDLGGSVIFCHEVNHANTDEIVYMRNPTLPIRWEVSNDGATTQSNYLDMICSSISTEGDLDPQAHDYSVFTTPVAVTQTRTPILAIRQSPTFNSKENRRTSILNTFDVIALGDNILYEAIQYPTPDITITGDWVDLDADHSTLQYAIGGNIAVNSETGSHPFLSGFVSSSTSGNKISPGVISTNLPIRTHHNEMLVNYDATDCETIVIWARSLSLNIGVTVGVAANCVEFG